MSQTLHRQVIVVGAGFGGLSAAKQLAKVPRLQVTVVDQRNHHLFQPLLYQVATAGLNPSQIAVPIRAQFTRAANVSVRLGRVAAVNFDHKLISLAGGGQLAYDFLVLACGAQHSYFGKPEWEADAPGLKTLEHATEIRRRILTAFEEAENELDKDRQRALLTFVVVGGGPTGVELAGAIADIARTVLVKDFRRIDPASARVVLVEAGPRILATFDESMSLRAKRDLERLGVEVRLAHPVTHLDSASVRLGDEMIYARSVFWAAGVQAAAVTKGLGLELDRAGRVKVNPDLSIAGHPEAFAIGDMAAMPIEGGQSAPGLAPAAIQAGRAAAKNIIASAEGQPRTAFRYVDKGTMATIGKRSAIVQVGRFRLSGFLAWLTWLFVHILYLIDFRNKVEVLTDWTWNYLFSRRGARLITNREWQQSDH